MYRPFCHRLFFLFCSFLTAFLLLFFFSVGVLNRVNPQPSGAVTSKYTVYTECHTVFLFSSSFQRLYTSASRVWPTTIYMCAPAAYIYIYRTFLLLLLFRTLPEKRRRLFPNVIDSRSLNAIDCCRPLTFSLSLSLLCVCLLILFLHITLLYTSSACVYINRGPAQLILAKHFRLYYL